MIIEAQMREIPKHIPIRSKRSSGYEMAMRVGSYRKRRKELARKRAKQFFKQCISFLVMMIGISMLITSFLVIAYHNYWAVVAGMAGLLISVAGFEIGEEKKKNKYTRK